MALRSKKRDEYPQSRFIEKPKIQIDFGYPSLKTERGRREDKDRRFTPSSKIDKILQDHRKGMSGKEREKLRETFHKKAPKEPYPRIGFSDSTYKPRMKEWRAKKKEYDEMKHKFIMGLLTEPKKENKGYSRIREGYR